MVVPGSCPPKCARRRSRIFPSTWSSGGPRHRPSNWSSGLSAASSRCDRSFPFPLSPCPGSLYPRTPRPHSLDHGATGTLTPCDASNIAPCDASNMGLAWWLQEGFTTDTNSYPISRARACVGASATDRRGRRTGGGRRSFPRIARCAGRHNLWPPASRRYPRAAADEPKSSGG